MTQIRTSLAVILLILIAGCVPALAQEPSVIVSDCSFTPAILMPGDKGMIRVTLTNTAKSAIETESVSTTTYSQKYTSSNTEINPTVESVYLDGRGDIRVLGGNSQFSGDIGPGQSVTLAFLIEAPEKNGIFFPQLRVRIRNAESVKYTIPVNVNMPVSALKTPALIITQPPPGFTGPGATSTSNLTLTNAGESAAGDVLVRILPNDGSVAAAGAAAFHFSRLDPGDKAALSLCLQASADADPGMHSIPLEITYTRIDGTRVVQQETVSLDVRGVSELGITALTTNPIRIMEGDSVTLVIRMENTGTGDAESTFSTIDLPFSGAKEAFIGTIRPGNDAPAVFTFTAGAPGEYEYLFRVHYQDDWGDHTFEKTLHLTVTRGDGAAGWIAILAVLGIAGAAGYLYMKRRREN
jgi:hypothetical protein